MKKKLTTLLVWGAVILAFLWLFHISEEQGPAYDVDFETFLELVGEERVASVRVINNEFIVTPNDSQRKYRTFGAMTPELQHMLSENGTRVFWGEEEHPLRTVLYFAIPIVLLLVLFAYFLRRAGGGTNNILAMRKSRVRLLAETSKARFSDIGGAEEAKQRLREVIDFLEHPKRWKAGGVRLPRGILLVGPPGCGKTLLARAVAGEARVPSFLVAASEFVEMFVGVGAARVRDMFETAAKKAPAVIFIDELDAVGRRRGSGVGASHDEREQTLNQILVCLDGLEPHEQIAVLAATNRPDVLDKALLRPGRFEVQIPIPLPHRATRLDILRIHCRGKPLADAGMLEELADRTEGFNGSALETLTNEAALAAVRHCVSSQTEAPRLQREHFLRALESTRSRERIFNRLDMVLIESASQLS
jgi:cell division protease FtsH